ncbi:MAG: heme exporter protein CcmB [Gammaproteobacteria bacterium]
MLNTISLFKREFRLAQRSLNEVLNPLIFFILIVTLFPLAISPNPIFLQKIAPGILWIAVLLAILLSLDRLFRSDFEDGSLEQIALTSYSLPMFIMVKIIVHWLLICLPCILLTPLLGLMLHLPADVILSLILSLLLGTPTLCLLGSVMYALTISMSNNAFLLVLLLIPLYIPILIFGVASTMASMNHLSYIGDLAMLASIFVLAATFAPFVSAKALRMGI